MSQGGGLITRCFAFGLNDIKEELQYAIKADERKAPNNALYIKWFKDDETKELTAKLNTANALDKMTEIYVVAPDFSWTYIKTHESMCGPYFMKL